MYTHNLDPVLFDFGFLVVRWYSLAYILGILIGWWLGKKIILKKFKNLNFNILECYELVLLAGFYFLSVVRCPIQVYLTSG